MKAKEIKKILKQYDQKDIEIIHEIGILQEEFKHEFTEKEIELAKQAIYKTIFVGDYDAYYYHLVTNAEKLGIKYQKTEN